VAIRPQPRQATLISCPVNEILYGGARGGGKSYGALLDWLAHAEMWGADAKGILFRRTMPELEDMMSKASDIFPRHGGVFKEQKKTWIFPNGARLKLRYLERDKHASRYQGHEYTWICFEEAGQWPSSKPLDALKACLRSAAGVSSRMILTANPGGVGHNWLKRRFIDPVPPMRAQYLAGGWTRVYIPATVQDNVILLKNDPGYVERIAQAASNPQMLRAWLHGDWDIVAGGMIDDLWNGGVHVLEPFAIPSSWRVFRAFDWGSAKPFSVGWWAVSDGTEVEVASGKKRTFPRGSHFRVGEWYGAKPDEANVGLKMTAKEIARGIRERETGFAWGSRVQPGPADSSIFDVENGVCIAADMEAAGVAWERADKRPGSRKNGAEKIRELLKAATVHPMESPGLFIFSTCRSFIALVPIIPRDENNPDDVDTKAEDHNWDETRYAVTQQDYTMQKTKVAGV